MASNVCLVNTCKGVTFRYTEHPTCIDFQGMTDVIAQLCNDLQAMQKLFSF